MLLSVVSIPQITRARTEHQKVTVTDKKFSALGYLRLLSEVAVAISSRLSNVILNYRLQYYEARLSHAQKPRDAKKAISIGVRSSGRQPVWATTCADKLIGRQLRGRQFRSTWRQRQKCVRCTCGQVMNL